MSSPAKLVKEARMTCLDAVFESLFAVAEDLLEVLRFIWNVEAVRHHLLQRLWMMEVKNLAGAVVALANVVEKKFDHSAQELRRLYLPRRTSSKDSFKTTPVSFKLFHCCQR